MVSIIILYNITLHYIILYYIILHYIVLYCIVLYYIILYYIILYYIILYYIILYYIILYYITMGPPSYMRSVVDRNVVMRRILSYNIRVRTTTVTIISNMFRHVPLQHFNAIRHSTYS